MNNVNDLKIDKQNGSVAFNDSLHHYWNVNDNSIKYISVTTLIEKYGQPFNKDFWSSYKALETLLPSDAWKVEKKSLLKTKNFDKAILDAYKISENDFNKAQQDILDSWDRENREACERGTKIHAGFEQSMYDAGDNVNLQKFGIGGKFTCKKNYSDLNLEYGVYPEYLIYRDSPDGEFHLAGQIDLLVKSGNDIIICDYKTNKKIEQKGFFDSSKRTSEKMKYPLNNLEECNFSHYSLQLSTYAWMLQKINPEFNIKGLKLIHIDHDGNQTIYDVPYLKNEVIKMLTHYKRELMLEKQNAKYKRIEY
jgi:hypothetical protein